MKLVRNDLENWEELINAVDKSDIPIEFVNRILIKLVSPINGEDSREIDVKQFRSDGYEDESINEIIKETCSEHYNNIKSMQFYLDVEYVASTVQKQTDKLLAGIQ
jgi:hypothetical protein